MTQQMVSAVFGYPITIVEEHPTDSTWIQPGWYVGDDNHPLSYGPYPTKYDAEVTAVILNRDEWDKKGL